MWITPILRPQGPFRLDNMPMHPPLWMHGHYRYPPGEAQQASRNRHRSPRNGCADLACPKHVERTRAGRTFATNMLFPRYPKQPQYPRFPQRLKRPLQSRQLNNRLNPQNPHCGIWPASSLPTNRLNRTGPNATVHDSSSNQSTRSSPYSPCRARSAQA